MQAATVVLDHDDMRRTLVRVAHEIIEKNPDGAIALVGIHRRGAVLAQRLHALTGELLDTAVPLGFVDISFYRDDLAIRPSAPIVHATQLDFPVDGRTIVIVDDVLYTGRTVRAAVDEVFDYGRPARVQLAVLVDRGHRELPIRPDYVGKNLPTSTKPAGQRPRQGDRRRRRGHAQSGPGEGGVTRIGPHLISIEDLDRAGIERILDTAESFAEVSGREIKKVPALRGTDGRQPLLRSLHPDQLELRARGQAAQRRRRQHPLGRLQRRQGRIAQGHGPDPVGLRPRRDRDPLAARGCRAARRWLDSGGGDQRR